MKRAYLELHLAVLLFGITAIFGKLIDVPAVPLVWWRVLLTSASLLLILRLIRRFPKLPRNRIAQYMGIGCLVGMHWITFFLAIKLSNVSVCLVAMATQSFFTAIVEPLVMGYRIRWLEIALGILIVPAMILIVGELHVTLRIGIWVGLLSAFLAALFTSLNKRLITHADPIQITFFELGSAWLMISLVLPLMYGADDIASLIPQGIDWLYLLLLSFVCTTLAYVLALRALRFLTAFASNLVVNLEPVYGIILAWIILHEYQELSPRFYAGVAVIIVLTFCYPFVNRHRTRKQRIK